MLRVRASVRQVVLTGLLDRRTPLDALYGLRGASPPTGDGSGVQVRPPPLASTGRGSPEHRHERRLELRQGHWAGRRAEVEGRGAARRREGEGHPTRARERACPQQGATRALSGGRFVQGYYGTGATGGERAAHDGVSSSTSREAAGEEASRGRLALPRPTGVSGLIATPEVNTPSTGMVLLSGLHFRPANAGSLNNEVHRGFSGQRLFPSRRIHADQL